MGDRNEYMREYMRNYRASKKGKGQGQAGQAASIESTEGQLLATPTEPGVYARYKWAWWLLAGVVIGLCAYSVVYTARNGTPSQRAILRDAFNPESTEGQEHPTEPVSTEGQEHPTEGQEHPTEGQGQE